MANTYIPIYNAPLSSEPLTPSALKQFCQQYPQIALYEIARHFGVSQDAARPLVEFWERKGKLVKLPEGTRCEGCTTCAPESIEMYRWQD